VVTSSPSLGAARADHCGISAHADGGSAPWNEGGLSSDVYFMYVMYIHNTFIQDTKPLNKWQGRRNALVVDANRLEKEGKDSFPQIIQGKIIACVRFAESRGKRYFTKAVASVQVHALIAAVSFKCLCVCLFQLERAPVFNKQGK